MMDFKMFMDWVKSNIQNDYDFDIDITKTTARKVYTSLVNDFIRIGVLDINRNCTHDYQKVGAISTILDKFDSRSSTFQKEVDEFCSDVEPIVSWLVEIENVDVFMIAISVIQYAKMSDIRKESVNKLINTICSIDTHKCTKTSLRSQLNELARFMQNNVVGQQILEVLTSSQMKQVLSSADDLLGFHCANRSLAKNNTGVPNGFMKSPEEFGIPVNEFLKLNHRLQCNESFTFSEVQKLMHWFLIDTKYIDLGEYKATFTVFDLETVRICKWFYWLFDIICYIENNDKAIQILNGAIDHLLETDKSFINVGYPFLTLAEIVLLLISAKVDVNRDPFSHSSSNLYSYYIYIRSTSLSYRDTCSRELSEIQSMFDQIYRIQNDIQKDICDIINVDNKSMAMEEISRAVRAGATLDKEDRALEGTNIIHILEMMDGVTEQDLSQQSDMKKILGESFELISMLEAALSKNPK